MAKAKKKDDVEERTQEEKETETLLCGLSFIRDGLLNSNLEAICNGYNIITEEGLELPKAKKKSKLETVREKFKQKTSEPEPAQDEPQKTPKFNTGKVGKMQVISTKENPKEKAMNEKIHAASPEMPRDPAVTRPRTNVDDPNRLLGYNDNPVAPNGLPLQTI